MRNLFSWALFVSQISLAQIPAFTSPSIVNSASLAPGAIAPREIVSIMGSNLGPASNACSGDSNTPPISCGGFSVLVNGNAASLLTVQTSRIDFEVPVDVSGSTATIQVIGQVGGQVIQSGVVSVPVAVAAPALYATTLNGLTIGSFSGVSGTTISPAFPALAGDILVVVGTGFGKPNGTLLGRSSDS